MRMSAGRRLVVPHVSWMLAWVMGFAWVTGTSANHRHCGIIDTDAEQDGAYSGQGGPGYTFPDECGILTSGCSLMEQQAFKGSNMQTLTVRYNASTLVIGLKAFQDVPNDGTGLNVRMQCEGGCTTSSQCTANSGGLSC